MRKRSFAPVDYAKALRDDIRSLPKLYPGQWEQDTVDQILEIDHMLDKKYPKNKNDK